MPRAHNGEMAAIERRKLWLAQALHDGEHCSVYKADAQVCVCLKQFSRSLVVCVDEVSNLERSTSDLVEDCCKRATTQFARNHVVDLYEHRRGDDPRLPRVAQQLCASRVLLVLGVEGGEQRSCVDD